MDAVRVAGTGLSGVDLDLPTHLILLANSTEHNLCEKICSYHGAKLDENRTSTPTNSTIMQSIGAVCRLVVISPAVSDFRYCWRIRRGRTLAGKSARIMAPDWTKT